MNRQELKQAIAACHAQGKKVAVSFCFHVPQEILIAAGLCSLRIFHIDGVEDLSSRILPKNICPVVAHVASLCEDGTLDEVDLLLAESSCDGKKKLFELVSLQEKIYYYQVPQGEDRGYVLPLIESEVRYLIRELQSRFGIEVTETAIRAAAEQTNRLQKSAMELMEIQKATPPPAWGRKIYEALQDSRNLFDPGKASTVNQEMRHTMLRESSTVPKETRRILLTGCPIGGVYEKVLPIIEGNGGVVVCFENCEMIKSHRRKIDMQTPDIVKALAERYRNTACAIMSPNSLRFSILRELVEEYRVDGIMDILLQTCHPYSVERDKMKRLSDELDIPYMAVEVDTGDADIGQLTIRISAFLEMLERRK